MQAAGSTGTPLAPLSGRASVTAPKAVLASTQEECQQCQALQLENAALRWRIRELERANEELLAAGVAASRPPGSSPTEGAGEGASCPAPSSALNAICSNCRREVPAINLDAHVMHCERNFRRCVACGEVVPVREINLHMESKADPNLALAAARRCQEPDEQIEALAALRSMRAHGLKLEDVTCRESGETLFHVAAKQGGAELLALVLGCGAPSLGRLSCVSNSGQAALHLAAAGCHEAVLALLLASGADIEQRSSAGDTPLLVACRSGAAAIVRRLVKAGADLSAKTALGDTAVQVAQSSGSMDCVLALGGPRRPHGDLAEAAKLPLPGVRRPPATPLSRSTAASREGSRGPKVIE
eukprot:TRINITY_DN65624_c0_g1_i1.p1 TRINITY_DN65624_c0_g1~~TRINITY_DN65624_c0_g1_i1.p1  ORF type:complete len:376 (-),score=82.76 TRINITY_DN65624_c0_g1_i1:35-1105(-)